MKKLKYWLQHCYHFGIVKGTLLAQNKLDCNRKVKISGVKYPFALRPHTSDQAMFHQVFVSKEYDNSLIINKLRGEGRIIIDGGANIGLFTIFAKNICPEAKIICVEPDPENFEALQKNAAPYSDVYCENCGLWCKDTILKVHSEFDKAGVVVEEDVKNGQVPAISIDTLLKKHNIEQVDILKLDIEGSEKQVFSANFEQWLPNVKMIVIELHDWIEAGCAQSFFSAVNKCFKEYRFDMSGENVIIQPTSAVF
jgi:FkbM family methyltransferase